MPLMSEIRSTIFVVAIPAYYAQMEFPVVCLLICDDAPPVSSFNAVSLIHVSFIEITINH